MSYWYSSKAGSKGLSTDWAELIDRLVDGGYVAYKDASGIYHAIGANLTDYNGTVASTVYQNAITALATT